MSRAKTRPKSVSGEVPSSASSEVFASSPSTTTSNYYYGLDENNYHQVSDSGSGSGGTGSISEYLMETLPGWRVEDLLEHPSCVSHEDNIISTNNNESYMVYDGSLQYHHQGFWEQKHFSWTFSFGCWGLRLRIKPTFVVSVFLKVYFIFFARKNLFVFVNKNSDLDWQLWLPSNYFGWSII